MSPDLAVVQPEPHVLVLNAQPLGQVVVDVLDGAHPAEAARVGQHALQRGVRRGDVTCREEPGGEGRANVYRCYDISTHADEGNVHGRGMNKPTEKHCRLELQR